MRFIINSLFAALITIGQGSSYSSAQTLAGGLTEEIIVTAQRREQNIQDVGITMSVLDAGQIQALSLRALPDITNSISNVELFEDYGGHGLPTWVIRGVGLQDYNANNTPTAAIYADDVYQVSNVMGAVSLFDIERVEVLKGPQGGLYGRNTSGGAIKVQSQRANLDELSGKVRAEYSSWQTWDMESAVNMPIGEKAAFRIAGHRRFSDDPWQSSLVDGMPHGEQDLWNARTWLTVEPGESTQIQWKLYAGVDNSELNLGRSIGMYNLAGEPCDAILSGIRDDSTCYNLSGVATAQQGGDPTSPSVQAQDGSTSLSQPINRLANEYSGSTLIIDQKIGDFTITSISNAESFNYGADMDFDGTPMEFGHNLADSDIRVWSQELRLASPASNRLSWIVGASLSREDFHENREFRLRDSIVSPLQIGLLEYDQNTRSQALFGDFNYLLTDDWSLHGTLRYTDEDKAYRNGRFSLPVFDSVFVDDLSSDYELGNRLMGNIGLNWTARENVLIYGSLSRGFKAGGFFGGFPLDSQTTTPYKEETVHAWEMGFKSSWDNSLRVNGAVFYYDYRDVQGYVVRFSEFLGQEIEQLTNQGNAEHYGAELEINWALSNQFDLIASAAWLDARITDSTVNTLNILGSSVPVTGRRPYAPRYSIFGAVQYGDTLNNGMQINASVDLNYRDDFGGHQSTLADKAVKQLKGYGLVNASFFLTPQDNNWTISIWGKNLVNSEYVPRVVFDSFGDFIDIPGQPRSAGVSLEMQW